MKFGDHVKVKAISTFEYNPKGKKAHKRKLCKYETTGIILRKTRRATGYYEKGSNGKDGFGDWDAEPPSLKIDKWHEVYEIATRPYGTRVLATAENIETRRCKAVEGDIYKYKNNRYRISRIGMMKNPETREWDKCVMYQPTDDLIIMYVRELEEFELRFEKE